MSTTKKSTASSGKAPRSKAAKAPAAECICPPCSKPSLPLSPFVEPREAAWTLTLAHVAENLQSRGFETSTTHTLAEAADLVMNTLLPESGAKVVSFGGSMTILEAGLLEAMKSRPELEVIDTFDTSGGPAAMIETRRQALLCDLFLTSANALVRDGVVMLIDGIGNRTAAVQFGPRKVILLIGRNKICNSMEAGIQRVKTMAAPANAIRLSRKTPCATKGYCMECKSPDRICSTWAIINRCYPPKRIHVVLINEEVGF